MAEHKEISRFTGSGKTFFFNRGEARNGTDYLAVNAIYGKGSRERMILFPPHFLEFMKHLRGAVEELAGVSFSKPAETPVDPPRTSIPVRCPECEYRSGAYGIDVLDDGNWQITCDNCHTVLIPFEEES